VVKRRIPIKSNDVSGNNRKSEGLFTVLQAISFGDYRTYDEEDHDFEVVKTSGDYHALILPWYVEKHKAAGTTTSHLHLPHCPSECFSHGKIHPEFSITYDKSISLSDKPIHIETIVMSNPTIAQKLPSYYHNILLLFNPKESEKLPDNKH
jgi:hypothetical protein